MDFDAAMNAHMDWKLKLRSYIARPDGSLNSATVAKDNECALGKWIYGEGKAYASIPEYSELKSEHAKFHKCASPKPPPAFARQR